jgi:hypothetical protein
MKRLLILSLLIFALPAYGGEDQAKSRRLLHISPAVLNGLNDDGTWNGYLRLAAAPCPDGPAISTDFIFSKVTTSDDIFDQLAKKLDATEKEAERIEDNRKKP